MCRPVTSKRLVPRRKSEIPRLSCPPTTVIVFQNIVVRDDIAVSIEPPGARLEAVACEVESMPLTRLFDVHAEVAYDPAGDYLHERQGQPFYEPDFRSGRQVLLGTRGVGINEAWSSMQEDDASLRSLCRKIVKRQARQECGVVDNRANTPLLVEVEIIFINPGLLRAVEDGQNVCRSLATLI